MKEKNTFFKYLDNPKMLMGMALQDLLSFAIPLYVGLCFQKLIIFGTLGFALFLLRRKIARTLPKFYLTGLVYWYIPTAVFNRFFKTALIPSHKRFYLR